LMLASLTPLATALDLLAVGDRCQLHIHCMLTRAVSAAPCDKPLATNSSRCLKIGPHTQAEAAQCCQQKAGCHQAVLNTCEHGCLHTALSSALC
jgi:hypothetical protein